MPVTHRHFPAFALVALAACGGGDRPADSSPAAGSAGRVDLTGAGATFPAPLYSRWFTEYANTTGVRINYQSIGSGGGIQQISEQTVDFGATDSPMTDDELSRARARGGSILHFPTVLGAVVITYNLPAVERPLQFSGDLLAAIFLGEITRWNDARIAAENPGVSLPASDILVVHRTDGSGTTFVFTDYLASVSPAWAAGPGRGKQVQWPVGLGGRGNEGVAGQIRQTPNAIGYVELAFARQNRLPVASIRNAAGHYVEPAIASITAAAEGAIETLGPASDYRVSIVNPAGAASYPIASFTWLLVYTQQPDAERGRTLVDFMRWMYTEGQQSAASLDYAPLPPALAERLAARLNEIHIGASP